MTRVLVINSGSSSLKYQLIEVDSETCLASGLVERIGSRGSVLHHTVQGITETVEQPIDNHHDAFSLMLAAFDSHGPRVKADELLAIGHRVVQGGALFDGPVLVDDSVASAIEQLSDLAPLHNPANLAGIQVARELFPTVPQVAVFDTAFHQTLAPEAYTYAIDRQVAADHHVRRYGFHGTSHKYVSERAAAFLNRPLAELRLIVLHLGNGASACAVDAGRSVDTSMGMTPLEGLVMGTRTGDLDPAVLLHLGHRGFSNAELDTLLNKRSGLLGLSGSGDVRDVTAGAAQGDQDSELALRVYTRRIRHYIGAYHALLGGAHAIVFTAGVGENSAEIRRRSLAGLECLGVRLDEAKNAERTSAPRIISAIDSDVTVAVIPTNEELEIARQCTQVVCTSAPQQS